MIQVRELTKYYGERPAIRDLSFDIDRGEVIGFLAEDPVAVQATRALSAGFDRRRGIIRPSARSSVDQSD